MIIFRNQYCIMNLMDEDLSLKQSNIDDEISVLTVPPQEKAFFHWCNPNLPFDLRLKTPSTMWSFGGQYLGG